MARLIDKDFSRLELFIEQYSISDLLKSKTREQLFKRGHKYSFAAAQIWAEVEKQARNGILELRGTSVAINTENYDQLAESFSDIISAYFSALHGIYKPANMSLRSAIETFTRGLAGISSIEAANTTSVYRLFELAKNCKPFEDIAALHFNAIHQEYAALCGFTHTSTSAHMIKNYAISNFPKQDIENLRIWTIHCERIIKSMLAILVISNKSLYLLASPGAQDVYEETVPKDARLFALGHIKYN